MHAMSCKGAQENAKIDSGGSHSMKVLIPEGFARIAESDFISGKGTAYFSKERRLLLFVIDEGTEGAVVLGPFKPEKLECFHHVLSDVKEMKGRYGQV